MSKEAYLPKPIIAWPPSSQLDINQVIDSHRIVAATGVPNFHQAQIPVPTKLHVPIWRALLLDYQVDPSLCDHIEYGFPVNYESPELPAVPFTNHQSALDYPAEVDKYIAKVVKAGAALGPFTENPLTSNLVLSPLQTAPKDTDSRRLIIDLSYPKQSSVNAGIPRDTYLGRPHGLSYPSVDNLVDIIIDKGPGCLLFKVDLANAYKQIFIDPKDYNLLGFRWRDGIFLELAFPFGLRSSALNCQRLTSAVAYLYKCQQGTTLINYLDDLGSAEDPACAQEAFDFLVQLLEDLGLETSPLKMAPPSAQMVFLGILLDTIAMTLSVPPEKIQRALSELDKWTSRSQASKRQLQSLVGTLCYIATCVKPGRRFTARIIDLLRADRFPVPLDEEFKLDITWWTKFMVQYNGVSLIQQHIWDYAFYADSSASGCSGHYNGQYFRVDFPAAILDQAMDHKKFMAILISCKLWSEHFKGCKILVASDNISVVNLINSGRSKHPFLQRGLRELWYVEAQHDFELRCQHVPTTNLGPFCELTQCEVPAELFQFHLI